MQILHPRPYLHWLALRCQCYVPVNASAKKDYVSFEQLCQGEKDFDADMAQRVAQRKVWGPSVNDELSMDTIAYPYLMRILSVTAIVRLSID